MSRRSRTTLSIEVRIPVPPGSNAAEVTDYVRNAVASWKGGMDPQDPLFQLATEELIVKLLRKETQYY